MSRRHLTPPTLIQPEPEKEGRAGLSTRMTISRDSLVMCRIGNFDDRYVITGKIGEGIFGTVYEVKHKRLRLRRALKVVKKRGSEHFSSLEEVEVLKRLDHPNILKIHEFYEAADSYFIITEVFQGRELFDVIAEQERLTEGDAAAILREVLMALKYTHSLGIAHRDIKPENILVRKGRQGYRIKIIDWGLGTLLGKGNSTRICGTPEYCAPEVLRGSHFLSCDMWSVGAIAYVMMTGEMPFSGSNTQETIRSVKRGIFNTQIQAFTQLSPLARQFILSLMEKNPQKRATAAQALDHPWVGTNTTREVEPVCLKETLQRLREMRMSNSLGTAVMSFVSNHLSAEEEREKLEGIFRHLDSNNDGVLSPEELTQGYIRIYGRELGTAVAEDTFAKLDLNHNHSLQFSQFVTFGLQQQKSGEEARLREAFEVFDRDGNGKISKEEIGLVLRGRVDATMEAEITDIIKEIDANGDQQIDVDEFIKSIERIPLTTTTKPPKQGGREREGQRGRQRGRGRVLRSGSKLGV